jgi:phosphate transport system permease protein
VTEPASAAARPPTRAEIINDRGFRGLAYLFAWFTLVVLGLLLWQIVAAGAPAMEKYGFHFLTSSKWDAGKGEFGIVPQIGGTLYSSFLGVFIGTIFGVAVAIFLTQDFIPHWAAVTFKNIVELLAAIPSVVYGLWGIFFLIPIIRPVCNWLYDGLHEWVPFFGTRLSGPGMLPAALVLAIMVLPTITAISRDALAAVPPKLREAAFGLGATHWETIFAVVLPTASRGIWGSVILAFGRALGETMALAMLVGNSDSFSWSVFAPGTTLAALIANKFPEASQVEVGALMYAAIILMLITLMVNIVGAWVIQRTSVNVGSAK